MMKRSNYGELSKLAKGRRVVKVQTEEHDAGNEAVATAKSKQTIYRIRDVTHFLQET
jgi:hypothetical protein